MVAQSDGNTINVESESIDEEFYYQMKHVASGPSKQMKWRKYQTVLLVNQQSLIVALMITKHELKLNTVDGG